MSKQKPEVVRSIRRVRRRKVAFGLNSLVGLLLLAVLLLMANYLSFRHYRRFDWSQAQYYQLSDKTHSLLNHLSEPVSVIVFFQPGQAVYEHVQNLLKEYQAVTDKIQVEWVDPDRDLARTEELAGKYEVDRANVVVFESQGRSKFVGADDIVEYDYQAVAYGQLPEEVAFRGEQAFSSAIQSVTEAEKPRIYFLQGHGEAEIQNYDEREGFSDIARLIRRDNVDVDLLTLGKDQAIPDDCDVLVIAGPQHRLSQPELELIEGYLDHSGRVLVLVDAFVETGLEPLLKKWGAGLASDLVVDATRTLSGGELFLTEYGNHPIVDGLDGITSILFMPRSVTPLTGAIQNADPADKPRVVSLGGSSTAGWAETDVSETPVSFDPAEDVPGPVSVAVAIEKGPVPGIDVRIRPTRMVVFGDTDFISNAGLQGGNEDLFMGALNWLLERDELLAIAPRPFKETQLVMDKGELDMLFWSTVLGLPGLVGLLGLVVWFRRRA
jgi:ABC-type uncharacterized transport system involved in gliding motility auxiliary subunit